MAEDICKPGVKVWHLKSPVIDIWLAREAAASIRMGEAFLLLMHKKTGRFYFPLADIDGSVVSFPTPVS